MLAGNNNPTKVYTYFDSLNQQFIVSYHDIPFYSNNPTGFLGSNTFQIILSGIDSTITFQYLKQIGNYDSYYNGSLYPFVIGIENITGNIGLMPTGVPINLSVKPKANTAITFYPPKTPKITVPDAEITWVENEENRGSFFPWRPSAPGPEPKHKAIAQLINVGLVNIDTPLFIAAHYTDPITDQLLHTDTLTIASLNQGESLQLVFEKAFYPPSAGNYALNIFITNPDDYSDLNVFNNSQEVEIVAIDTTKNTATLSYNLDLAGISLLSADALGTAVYFEPHGYPVEVISLEYYVVAEEPVSEFKAQLFAVSPNSDSIPGILLFEQEIQASEIPIGNSWVKVDLPTPIKIDSLGFYAAWNSGLLHTTKLLTEATRPISLWTYDILDSNWITSQNNFVREPMIRAVVNIENVAYTVGINDVLDGFQELSIYPNPSSGNLTINLKQENPEKLALRIMDMQGRKVYWEMMPPMEAFTKSLDLTHLPAGIYSIQIIKENSSVQKQWVKRD